MSQIHDTKVQEVKKVEEVKVEDGYTAFRQEVSTVVAKQLSKYHRDKRIAGRDDFKYLCRKISHTVRSSGSANSIPLGLIIACSHSDPDMGLV